MERERVKRQAFLSDAEISVVGVLAPAEKRPPAAPIVL